MSADLIWQVLRTHNSHIVKRDGITLSGEPGNLTNLHTYKFSGLANPLTVHVALKDKKIALTKNRNAKSHRTPATGRVVVPLNKHRRDGSTRAAKTIQSATVHSHYRPDLVQHAVARYHALYQASKAKEGQGVNVKRRRTPAKEKRAQKAAASA